jgi:hypothetical protein
MGKCTLLHFSVSKAFSMTLTSVCKHCTKGTSHRKNQNTTHGHNAYTLDQISSVVKALPYRAE